MKKPNKKQEEKKKSPGMFNPKFSPLAKKLDAIAERYGVDPAHLAHQPAMLAGTGISPEDVDAETAQEARRYGRNQLGIIAARYGASISH